MHAVEGCSLRVRLDTTLSVCPQLLLRENPVFLDSDKKIQVERSQVAALGGRAGVGRGSRSPLWASKALLPFSRPGLGPPSWPLAPLL